MTEKREGGITGKGFTKGDPRINRRGRPKDFDALRALTQEIAHEAAMSNGQPIVQNGNALSIVQAMMRKWAMSNNADLQKKFIAIAFGEVPTETKHTGDKDNPVVISVNHINYRDGLTTTEG